MAGDERFQMEKDRIRKRFLKYTGRAFRILPQINKPRILDIGCGSGVPTLELARLSHGEVMAIDIDQPALDKFARKIKEALEMTEAERRRRMKTMREVVSNNNIYRWGASTVSRLISMARV